ncbi:putative nucleic acid-binding protein [Spinactinospora alkalitolerans]|uniref:Ribonuclease VapC n=1 Tax=Spinactinospora alkalitolerans TaxID=687207 RepID=A0A852TXY5_9ACTN|nr:type II toxin-antitoxin system VapC family toxin [Spinactinospora alkalitolerans]NYE48798.1 putative nucleic acid-binding protein [Spinactinospora alkalitolerans]
MIIVDASVLANSLIHQGEAGKRARAELHKASAWAAPEHAVTEAFSVIRGLCLGGKVEEARALTALDILEDMPIHIVQARSLLQRMWELRGNISGYDAAYVATAESHGCPLVTTDRKIARAPGLKCEIRVLPNE